MAKIVIKVERPTARCGVAVAALRRHAGPMRHRTDRRRKDKGARTMALQNAG